MIIQENYNKTINGWRGIFALFIFLLHFWGIYIGKSLFETSYLAVEGFFIISGYLLAKELDGKSDILLFNIIRKKIRKLYPKYILSILILVCLWIVIPDIGRYFSVELTSLFGEIFLLQCSGFFPFKLVNGVSWFVSALMIVTVIELTFYKLIKEKIYLILPFIILIAYSIIYLSCGNLDCHGQRYGVLLLGIVRASGGISLGMLCFQLSKNDVFHNNQKLINIVEIISTFLIVYMLVGKQHSYGDFVILLPISLCIICSRYGNGLVDKVLSCKIFQYWGKISYEIYLYQFIVIYMMVLLVPRFKEYPVIITIVAAIFLLAVCIIVRCFFKFLRQYKVGEGCVDLFIRRYRNEILIISAVSFIYLFQGVNPWAEIVAEYMPYANGASLQQSFAGYITIFPIFIATVWNKLIQHTGISYVVFTCFVSYLYALLCVLATYKVLKKRNRNNFLFLLPLFSVLVHPSVQSLINITHLGYLPLIIHIVCCAEEDNIVNDISDIPKIVYIPLAVAVISKPSLSFLVLLCVLITTKLYKNILGTIVVIITIIISGCQTFLYSDASSSLNLSGIFDILKAGLTFIQSIGASILFDFIGYIEHFNNSSFLMFVSFLCGGFVILVLALHVIRERTYNAIISTIILLVTLGFANLPYMMIDYSMDTNAVLLSNMTSCFWKYKLQYQMTSGTIELMIFAWCIDYLRHAIIKNYDHNVEYGIQFIFIILAINGVLTGLYHGTNINVQGLNSELISYDNDSHYIYAPYPDWDYSWSQSSYGGWVKGNMSVKYLDKPLEEGGGFRNYNNDWKQDNIEDTGAKIYLMLSEKSVDESCVPCWLNLFYERNQEQVIRIGNNLDVIFSEIGENGIRYAVIPYTQDNMEMLGQDDIVISYGDMTIESDRLNCMIVW